VAPFPCTTRLLAPLYYDGRLDEARTLYRRALAHDSVSIFAHEALGAVAARQRDMGEAALMDQWLADHPSRENGRSTYARARIALLLGDTARAMTLLRQAFDEGLMFRMYIHVDPDLEPLRGLPAYRQLVALTG
jgi:hypothetical protein